MKRFLLHVACYLGALLLLASALQCFISLKIKHRVLYGGDNLHVVKGQKNEIVCLGNSRCYNHADPLFFHDSMGLNAVNLGIIGHDDLALPMIRLKYYLEFNPSPKVVLLCFDPFMISGDFNGRKLYTKKDNFSRYAFLPKKEDKDLLKYFEFDGLEEFVPLYAILKYKIFLKCVLPIKKTIWEEKGVEICSNIWDTTKNPYNTGRPAALNTYAAFGKYYDSIKAGLQVFNNFCKERNIRLVCVQMPVFKGIYDKSAFDLVDKMCAECGILSVNTNKDEIIRDPSNFSDPKHLNYIGVPKTLNVIIKDERFIEMLRK